MSENAQSSVNPEELPKSERKPITPTTKTKKIHDNFFGFIENLENDGKLGYPPKDTFGVREDVGYFWLSEENAERAFDSVFGTRMKSCSGEELREIVADLSSPSTWNAETGAWVSEASKARAKALKKIAKKSGKVAKTDKLMEKLIGKDKIIVLALRKRQGDLLSPCFLVPKFVWDNEKHWAEVGNFCSLLKFAQQGGEPLSGFTRTVLKIPFMKTLVRKRLAGEKERKNSTIEFQRYYPAAPATK